MYDASNCLSCDKIYPDDVFTIVYHWYELLMVKTIKGWLVTSQLYSSG